MIKKTTLENGLRILTIPQDGTKSVTVFSLIGTGSKYETKDVSGISHFLEHMFFKGTASRKKPIDVLEVLDKIGGIYNAFTGEEYTGYYAKVESSKVETALDWVSDIYLNSTLPTKELNKEKGVIIEEINMYKDNPMEYVHILWSKLLYGNQPAGWFVAGEKKSVLNIDRKKMTEYRDSQYVASNTIVCIAGDIESDKGIELTKKYFSKISKSKPKEKKPVVERQNKPEVLLNYKKTDQTHFCLGFRSYNINDKRKYTAKILTNILGGMMSSRLFMELREKMGLAYYIRSINSTDSDTGTLFANAGVDNKKVFEAIETTLKEFKKLTKKKVSLLELNKSKDYIKGKMALSLEPSDEKAFYFSQQELLTGKILSIEDIYKEIDKVTEDDILEIAKDLFISKNLNLALVGPFKDKLKFEKILNNF